MIQAGDYVVSNSTNRVLRVVSNTKVTIWPALLVATPTLQFRLYPEEVRLATDSEVLEAKLKGLL